MLKFLYVGTIRRLIIAKVLIKVKILKQKMDAWMDGRTDGLIDRYSYFSKYY